MASSFGADSFNVLNLFCHADILYFRHHSIGDQILVKIPDFRKLLKNQKKLKSSSNGVVDVEKVNNWTNVTSDHGAIWVEFNLQCSHVEHGAVTKG